MNNEAHFAIWRSMCRIREFDEQVYKAVESKRVKCFVYLSSGQEAIAASVAEAFRGFKPTIFCQHRSHAAYIAFGGDVVRLRDELLLGKLGDPMIHDPKINFIGHSGLVGDQVPIAVGYAFASNTPVVCFLGDSTVEEDVFWPSLGFAVTHDLPVLFVCEDNGLSVVTRTEKRRSWDSVSIADAYNINTYASRDEPQVIYDMTVEFTKDLLPTYGEFSCCRKYRHVGIGVDNEMAWDRMTAVRNTLRQIDRDRADRIEADAISEMEDLWK